MIDYLIVGAGPFGCVFAREMKKLGKSVLIIDKRNHIGGNTFTKKQDGIDIHVYGAHIFHTNDETIWNYVNSFTEFLPFVNSPVAKSNGELYNLPFNMNTFYKLWGVETPADAKAKISEETKLYKDLEPKNLEEQALKLVGHTIYNTLIKGYTEKQWGCDCKDLPAFIIKRLPLRYTFDNNYFNDKYQGIPKDGYTVLWERVIKDIDVQLETDFFKIKDNFDYRKVVFTGKIDEYFGYQYGKLDYRGLRFETEKLNVESYQGNAVVNYTDHSVPFTRILEHKHFNNRNINDWTYITREYPLNIDVKGEPYYPINNERNNNLYSRYKDLASKEKNVIFGGRLAEYKYYDMHQIIARALKLAKNESSNYYS